MLTEAGFRGLYLDRAGYADDGVALEAELTRLLGVRPLVSRTGRQLFFNLTAYAAALRGGAGEAEWEGRRQAALHRVGLRWGTTFSPLEQDSAGTYRWCVAKGQLRLHNPLDRPRTVVLEMQCSLAQGQPACLIVDGKRWRQEMTLTTVPQPLRLEVVLPPGNHLVHFSCNGAAVPLPGGARLAVFRVGQFRCRAAD